MTTILAQNWWALALRGVAAVLFGVAAFVLPGLTLAVLILLFGAYALVDGVLGIVAAVRAAERHERWWPMLLEGVAGILAGGLTFVWPAVTAILLLYLMSFWAIVIGILKIVGAVRLRRVIHGEWLLGVSGALSVLFGLLLIIVPGVGILSVVWLVAVYAIIRGIAFLALGFRLRRHHLLQLQRVHPS